MALLRDGSSTANGSRPQLTTTTSSTMKLPQILRRGSAVDTSDVHMEQDTRRGSIPEPSRRSSLSTLPLRLRRRKTQTTIEQTDEDTEAAERLSRLFFSLPSEILAEIIIHLSLNDIYALRQVSQGFNQILNFNASIITRPILQTTLAPATTTSVQTSLYPVPSPCPTDLSHMFTMLRRQHLIDKQIYNLLAFVQMKIYMTRTVTRVLSVTDNRQKLIEAFQRPAWFLTHFLEHYRDIVLFQHPTHNTPTPNCSSCQLCRSAARAVVASYPIQDVMPVYHMAQLTLEHLQIATRAPMAAGPLERRLRGWAKVPVTEENLAIFVVLGGIPEIGKVAMMQGSYNSRMGFVAEFVEKAREAVAVNSILKDKTRMGFVQGGSGSGRSASRGGGDDDESGLGHLGASLRAPLEILTQEHITSLPNVSRLFYDIWKERIEEIGPETVDIYEPYPWLQRVMSGSGLEFEQSRTPDIIPLLSAPPV